MVTRLGAGLLALSGLYLIAYWLPALGGHSPNRSVAALTASVSTTLTQLLEANAFPISVDGIVW